MRASVPIKAAGKTVERSGRVPSYPRTGRLTRHARSASVSRGSSREHFEFGDRRVFKMSIGEAANPNDDYLFDEAIESGRILLGWGDKVDWAPDAYQSRDA